MDELLEKVIYSIERCTCNVPDACRDCAYDAGQPYNECVELLLKDALSLLKAQKPENDGWHDLTMHPSDLPSPGERVNICVGYSFVGEGYLKQDGLWYRYCDLDPVEKFMSQPVVGWKPLPPPMKKKED